MGCGSSGKITFEFHRKMLAADTLLLVDESGSMGQVHRWILKMVITLEKALKENDIGVSPHLANMYGLVGFGRPSPHEKARIVHTANGQSFFSASDFTQASEQLVADGHGTIKDGYEAIKVAISGLIFSRSYNLVRHIILITGSDRTLGQRPDQGEHSKGLD